jgi:hypothetical protein
LLYILGYIQRKQKMDPYLFLNSGICSEFVFN